MNNRVAVVLIDKVFNLEDFLEKLEYNNFSYLLVYYGTSDEEKEYLDKYVRNGKALLTNTSIGKSIKSALNYILEKYRSDTLITLVTLSDKIEDILRVTNECMINKSAIVLGNNKDEFNVDALFTKSLYRLNSGKSIKNPQTFLRCFSYNFLIFLKTINGESTDYLTNMVLECSKKNIDIIEIDLIKKEIKETNKKPQEKIEIDLISMAINYVKYIIDFIIFVILNMIIKEHIIVTNIFARIISFIISLKKEKINSSIDKTLNKYIVVALVLLVIDTLGLLILVNVAHIPIIMAKILMEVVYVLTDRAAREINFSK